MVVIEGDTLAPLPVIVRSCFRAIANLSVLEMTPTLGVCNRRTRSLLPSSETTPSTWADGVSAIGPIVRQPWIGREISREGDGDRTTYELLPCKTCAPRIRLPSGLEPFTAAGPAWWAEWNSSTHATPNPGNPESLATWGNPSLYGRTAHRTRSQLGANAIHDMGCGDMPDCSHM